MVRNFDRIRPSVRERYLGPIGTATRAPRTLPQREAKAVTTDDVVIPKMTLRYRFPRPQAPPLPDEPPVLAPEAYEIVYKGMHCIDETHWDSWGSDEIYILTSAAHITSAGGNEVRTERHPKSGDDDWYGDVDSHETRIGPRAACWQQRVADIQLGMSLTTVVMEHDHGDPNYYRDQVDAAVKLALAIASYEFPPGAAIFALIAASGLLTDFFNWLLDTDDDEVGTVTVVLDLADLEDYSRSLLINYSERPGSSTPTGLEYHFLASVNDNDYVSAYQVVRDPPAPPYPPGPVE
jgi:hypothetical protein